jgi:hypothetical protein
MKTTRAFTLIEVLAVAFIITLVTGLLIPPALSSFIIRQRLQKEDAVLAALAADIEKSFEARDLDTFNVSALPGEIDFATRPTEFSTSVAPSYPWLTGFEWFAKIGRARGFSVMAGLPVSKTSQPALHHLAFNDSERPRLLFAGPPETARQRYLLLSLIGRDDELVLPPFMPMAEWFNAIWDTPWDRFDAQLPSMLMVGLSWSQVANWNLETEGKSRLYRLRVVRITQRKHEVVVNANHPTDSVWVRWNNDDRQYTLLPGSGTWTSPATPLAGRILSLYVGDSFPNAKKSEITVRERTVFTSQ